MGPIGRGRNREGAILNAERVIAGRRVDEGGAPEADIGFPTREAIFRPRVGVGRSGAGG